jgi:hypothetical protein
MCVCGPAGAANGSWQRRWEAGGRGGGVTKECTACQCTDQTHRGWFFTSLVCYRTFAAHTLLTSAGALLFLKCRWQTCCRQSTGCGGGSTSSSMRPHPPGPSLCRSMWCVPTTESFPCPWALQTFRSVRAGGSWWLTAAVLACAQMLYHACPQSRYCTVFQRVISATSTANLHHQLTKSKFQSD